MPVNFDTNRIKTMFTKKRNDFLLLAAEVAMTNIKLTTPIDTGNLMNSTGRSDISGATIQVNQTAEYAIFVELRQFHFSRGLGYAETPIQQLAARIFKL